MPAFSQASLDKLATCDTRLQGLLREAIKHIDFTILEGHRGQAAQDQAFAEKKSKLMWPHGKHNALPSRAVDIAPYYTDGGTPITWKDVPAFARLMGYIERIADERGIRVRLGMDWDGDFRTAGHDPGENFLDAPHLELVDP